MSNASYAQLFGLCKKQNETIKQQQEIIVRLNDKITEAAETMSKQAAANSVLTLQIELLRKKLKEGTNTNG